MVTRDTEEGTRRCGSKRGM